MLGGVDDGVDLMGCFFLVRYFLSGLEKDGKMLKKTMFPCRFELTKDGFLYIIIGVR